MHSRNKCSGAKVEERTEAKLIETTRACRVNGISHGIKVDR